MQKTLVAAAIAGSLALAPGLAAPAHAEHADWYVGGGFRIGPVHFNIVLGGPGHRYHGHHYYRSKHRVQYRGYQCNDRCFKQGGYDYHDPYCPTVLHHFDRYRANPYAAWDRYAPRHREPYLQYRDRGDYGRGYHDDRGYRGRGYDRDHRYRGRGHDRHHRRHRGHSCPYDH